MDLCNSSRGKLQCVSLMPVLLCCVMVAAHSRFTVLISPMTPPNIQSDFESLEVQSPLSLSTFVISDITAVTELPTEILIDALNVPSWSAYLSSLVGNGEVVSSNEYSWQGQIPLFSPRASDLHAVSEVVKWLKPTRLAVFLPPLSSETQAFAEATKDFSADFFTISEGESGEAVERLLRKQVVLQGFTSAVIALPSNATAQLMAAMKRVGVDKHIYEIVCTRQSALILLEEEQGKPELSKSGFFYIVDKGCETVKTNREFLLCKLTQITNKVLTTDYSILTSQFEGIEVIGEIIDGKATIVHAAEYYRSISSTPIFPTLPISFNNGTVNPSGEAGTAEPFDYAGVQVAIRDINTDFTILPFHVLTVFNVSLGLFEFNSEWVKQQLDKVSRADLGLAILEGTYSSMVVKLYELFTSIDITIPHVGSGNTLSALSSRKEFPLFTRMSMSQAYLSILYSRMLKHFGWSNIAILYCEDSWSVDQYELITRETQRLGINTINNEKYRQLPTEMTGNYSEYLEVYNEIIDTKARVVIMLLWGQTLYKSLEAFYDLGMREGDLFFLAAEWLEPALFEVGDEVLKEKIKVLCNGILQFYPATFVGTAGKRAAEHYRELFKREAPFDSCFYYDATYMIANAIDYLIVSGGEYTSPFILDSAIRKTRFRGCTGIVTLAEGTNDRYPMMYDIMNSQVFANGSYRIKAVGTYDPSGLVLFNFTFPIVWPDNSTNVPTDLRGGDSNCPFEEKLRLRYMPGVAVHAGATAIAFILGIILITIGLIWIWKTEAEPLTQHCEISFEDYKHFATIGIEILQYASLGPTIPHWTFSLFTISNMSTLSLSEIISLRKGVYWLLLLYVFAAVLMWAVLICIVYFRLDKKLGYLCARLLEYGELTLPLLGHICFLPIVCSLLSVFDCEDAVTRQSAPSFSDTVLSSDCYVHCWRMPHTAYVCSASFLLLVYLPTSILLRPYWQQRQLYLHISTSPRFLMLQTTFELFLVLLRNTLRYVSELVHSIIFSVSVSVFLAASLATKPYGYRRSNLWHSISLLILQWYSILSTISRIVWTTADIFWFLSLYSMITLLFIFGTAWQAWKVPAMLHRRQGLHVVELFRFMFSRGDQHLNIFQHRTQRFTIETAIDRNSKT